jgi:hypothetical protein
MLPEQDEDDNDEENCDVCSDLQLMIFFHTVES